jgi:23S rRNA (adenine2503-C2)-methyltransferase
MNPGTPIDLLELTPEQLADSLAARGEKRFRAGQLLRWVYGKGVTDVTEMTDVPDALAGAVRILSSRLVDRRDSRDGTCKLLLEYPDRSRVECVMIPERDRATACLSTQVGCATGCGFCASAAGGLVRNLTAGEILPQVLHLRARSGREITHAVFMGMGEPLANYRATLSAVRAIVDPDRLGVSARRVTVSTVGLPGRIRRLAKEKIPLTLAISLHAPHEALRKQLIPHAPATIEEILAAAEDFFRARKREVTLEYLLLAGVNDTKVCCEALARLAGRLRCNVNLIRYNPVEGLDFRPPSQDACEAFCRRLRGRGVNAHLRRSRGADTDAACGQLRQRNQT